MISAKDSLQALSNFQSFYSDDNLNIQPDIFRKAKLNQLNLGKELRNLKEIVLFLILRSYNTKQLDVSVVKKLAEDDIDALISFYLMSVNAPFFVCIEEQELMDLNSARNLLVVLGWLQTVDGQTEVMDKCITTKISNMNLLSSNEVGDNDPKAKQKTNVQIPANLTEVKDKPLFTDQKDEIIYYMSLIKNKKTRIAKYQEIRDKKLKQVQNKLGNNNYNLKDLLLICDKKRLDSLVDSKSEQIEKIKKLETKIVSRELLFEWLEDTVVKDKEGVNDYSSYADIDDGEISEGMLEGYLKNTRIKLSDLWEKINTKIAETNDIKETIKKFLVFWEGISGNLRSNKTFLDIVKDIIKQKNQDLIQNNVSPDMIENFMNGSKNKVVFLDFFDWVLFNHEDTKKNLNKKENSKKNEQALEKQAKEASDTLEFESKKISYDFEEKLDLIREIQEKQSIKSVSN